MIEWSLKSRPCVGQTVSGDEAVALPGDAWPELEETATKLCVDLSDTATVFNLREPLRVRRLRRDRKG